MMDLRELYQDIILDHGRHPRNFRPIEHPTHTAKGYNPLCGDRETVFVRLEEDVLKAVGFRGTGCAISTASASLMSEAVKGKSKGVISALFEKFHAMVTGKGPSDGLDKLEVFSGVRE